MAGSNQRPGRGWLIWAGVVLICLGMVVAGSVGWQTWVASPVAASAQERAAAAQGRVWSAFSPERSSSGRDGGQGGIPVQRAPGFGRTVAVVVIPRFGSTWKRVIREGVDEAAILNSFDAGVGHYPGTAMPGALGNFAIAAHDTGYGDAFRDVGVLQIGDPIYIQTRDGWYTYRFRNLQWVQPSEVAVIQPVPEQARAAPTARLITLTTCDPPYNAQEREIAYGTLEHFHAGPTPPWTSNGS